MGWFLKIRHFQTYSIGFEGPFLCQKFILDRCDRFYIDNGADMVVHHTHCISGMEAYKGKPIYYSLGNFLFTKFSRYEDWYTGIVLEIEIDENKEIKTCPIFVQQEKDDFKLSLIDNDDYRIINERFATYSNTISNQRELLKNWEAYVLEKVKLYDNYWSPLSFIKNKWVKKIITRLQLKGDNQKGKALALNLMRCEAHFDMSKEVLNKIINNK